MATATMALSLNEVKPSLSNAVFSVRLLSDRLLRLKFFQAILLFFPVYFISVIFDMRYEALSIESVKVLVLILKLRFEVFGNSFINPSVLPKWYLILMGEWDCGYFYWRTRSWVVFAVLWGPVWKNQFLYKLLQIVQGFVCINRLINLFWY